MRGDFGSPLGQTPASAAWVSLHARMRDRGEPCAKYQKYNAFIFSASPSLTLSLTAEGERDRLTRRDHISVTGSAGRRLRVPATRRSPVSSRPIQTHLAAPAAGRCRRRHDVDACLLCVHIMMCTRREESQSHSAQEPRLKELRSGSQSSAHTTLRGSLKHRLPWGRDNTRAVLGLVIPGSSPGTELALRQNPCRTPTPRRRRSLSLAFFFVSHRPPHASA